MSTLEAPAPSTALVPTQKHLSTFRLVLEETGRFLLTGFIGAQPTMGIPGNRHDEERAAEFPSPDAAWRVSRILHERMKARTDEMGQAPPPRLTCTERPWDTTTPKGSFAAWDAIQRMDRTSVEIGRLDATSIPAWMRTVKP